MGLPNATSILSTLPGGLRVTVKRGSVVASLAVRTSITETGQSSEGVVDRFARANIWTIMADFDPRIKVGDMLTVNGIQGIVVEATSSCGDLISRATVVLGNDIDVASILTGSV